MSNELPSRPEIYVASPNADALRQGELITGLCQLTYSVIDRDDMDADFLDHEFALVASQDCDLEWDFPVRYHGGTGRHKLMQDILFCVVSKAAVVRHESDPGYMNSKLWDRVKGNTDERYHFLQQVEPEQDAQGKGLPELVADFKLYFSIPVDSVYKQIEAGTAFRRCSLKSPYLEHYFQRYGSYQTRVALPGRHESSRGS